MTGMTSPVGGNRGPRRQEGFRVAMVASRYAPMLGGTETHVQEVAQRLAARGVDVTVLTTDLTGTLAPSERQGQVLVLRFRAWPRFGDVYASPGLARAIAIGGYDLVHVQGIHTFLPVLALRAARRSGAATVVTFHTGGHSNRVRTAMEGAHWRALRTVLRPVDAFVAVCRFEVGLFSRALAIDEARFDVIANGADPLPVSDSTPRFAGDPLVVSVGRLERYKGHHRLIAAMPTLLARSPGARLVIVGTGPYDAHLHDLAARLKVAHAVAFTSFDRGERAELGSLVAAADLVALLSDYEAHPVAVMEALALGRKVLVAETSGLAELTAHDLVRAIPLGAHPNAIADAIVRSAGLLGGVAPHLASWDDCANDLLAVYERVLDSR